MNRKLSLTCPKCSKQFEVRDGKVVPPDTKKGQSDTSKGNDTAMVLTCDNCGASIRLKNPPLGKKVKFSCPKCGKQVETDISVSTNGKVKETPDKNKNTKTTRIPFVGTVVTTFDADDSNSPLNDLFGRTLQNGGNSDAGNREPQSKDGFWARHKKKREEKKALEEAKLQEALQNISSSPFGLACADVFCGYLQPGGKYYEYLAQSERRNQYNIRIEVNINHIMVTKYHKSSSASDGSDSSLQREKYSYPDEQKELPDSYHVRALVVYLTNCINERCPRPVRAYNAGSGISVQFR